jgi:exonuclease 1
MYRTDDMMEQLIEKVKAAGYESIIAPYEADAQLAYMARNMLVAGVITIDADLVAYGMLLCSDLM